MMTSPGVILDAFIQSVLAALILAANISILLLLYRHHSLHSPTNLIIASLAVADLAYGLTRPLMVAVELGLYQDYWTCLVASSIAVMLGSASMHMLIWVSVDRYIQITRPLRYHTLVTYTRVTIAVLASWVVCGVFAFTPVYGMRVESYDGSQCTVEAIMLTEDFIVSMAASFNICVLILVYVYYKIYSIAVLQRRRVAAETVGRQVSSLLATHLQSAKLFATLCGYFLFSWAPFFLNISVSIANGRKPVNYTWSRICYTLAVGNSLGNPVLYALRQADVKRILKRKFPSIFNRKRMNAASMPSGTYDTSMTLVD